MASFADELKKLGTIASDLELTADLRIKAIEMLGKINTHEALLVLLDLAANEKLVREERVLATKQASKIIKSS